MIYSKFDGTGFRLYSHCFLTSQQVLYTLLVFYLLIKNALFSTNALTSLISTYGI